MTKPITDDGTAAVLIHVLMNELSIIGSAVQTLEERGDALAPDIHARMLLMMREAVLASFEHLRIMLRVDCV